ncbi:hypothetical protein BYT27DRAFT_6694604 [Phlegmacium glaucopus]|nr:hypothetical protein BYT27DRAFT_6694604 [Phlegmacium glaucopus]
MHFPLSSISIFFLLTTCVQTAPTAPLDAATLLKNAQEAQGLNAQFRSGNSTATGSCTNGDTTCAQNAIATCVNGQFAISNVRCPATQQCFALPSVKANGTIVTCTSEKNAQSVINAAGATGDVTGSGSGASTSPKKNHGSASPTSSTPIAAATSAETAASMDADCMTDTPTSRPTATTPQSVVTVTVTVIPSVPTTLPPVTTTLSPDQASSLLAQGGPAATDEPDCGSEPSEALTSAFPASATDIPPVTASYSMATQSAEPKITPSASASATTAAAIANNTGSSADSGSGYGAGGYSGY